MVYKYDIENRLVEKRTQIGTACPVTNYTGTLQANLVYDPLGRLFQTDKGTTATTTTNFPTDGDALAPHSRRVGCNASLLKFPDRGIPVTGNSGGREFRWEFR
jgi:hypothetical protein